MKWKCSLARAGRNFAVAPLLVAVTQGAGCSTTPTGDETADAAPASVDSGHSSPKPADAGTSTGKPPSGDGGTGAATADAGALFDGAAMDSTVPGDGPADGDVVADAALSAETSTALEDAGADASSYRDPLLQPFASTSIWNMPIGSGAAYVPATITIPTANTLQGDQDILVLTPTAPATAIYENSAAWQPAVDRCPYNQGQFFYSVPVPNDFIVGDNPISDTPNNSFAVLLSDNRTLKQNQPFTRCTAGQPATTYNTFPDVDLYGDGASGAHGGSALSAIGGTLRLGELRPGAPAPRHALKLELFAAQNYYNDGNSSDCYRWPATTCDGYFNDSGALKYGGTNAAVRPGSLLALPASLDIASLGLTTGAATLLAWTLQNYGAYLVDDSAWSSVSICVEYSPAGAFEDQFQSDWGFALNTSGTTSAFAKDVSTLLAHLSVVNNNSASTIGGGGTPLQPLASPLPPPP